MQDIEAASLAGQVCRHAEKVRVLVHDKPFLACPLRQFPAFARKQLNIVPGIAELPHAKQGLPFASPPAALEVQLQDFHALTGLRDPDPESG